MTESLLTVTIDALAGGGDGVAHVDGRAVFVPDTAPGDRVTVRVTAHHKRYSRGELSQLLEAGPGRKEPSCELSLVCGGCQWHHLRYDAQLGAKEQLLARAFRQARVDAPAAEVHPAPAPLHYRCRARLGWRSAADDGVSMGFRGRRSHELVQVHRCPVLLPGLSDGLPTLRDALAPRRGSGEALLLGNESGQQALALYGLAGEEPAADLGGRLGLTGTVLRADPKAPPASWGRPRLNRSGADDAPFWTAPEVFCQANPAANRRLCDVVSQWAQDVAGLCVELYAGSGNLTRGLAARGPVVAVESDPAAVDLGRENVVDPAVQWRTDDAARALGRLADDGAQPVLVVLDPPRTGARAVIGDLVALGPPQVLYVSCDPMTLARDVSALAAAGYALQRVALVDTLPQTSHFEAVVWLARALR